MLSVNMTSLPAQMDLLNPSMWFSKNWLGTRQGGSWVSHCPSQGNTENWMQVRGVDQSCTASLLLHVGTLWFRASHSDQLLLLVVVVNTHTHFICTTWEPHTVSVLINKWLMVGTPKSISRIFCPMSHWAQLPRYSPPYSVVSSRCCCGFEPGF